MDACIWLQNILSLLIYFNWSIARLDNSPNIFNLTSLLFAWFDNSFASRIYYNGANINKTRERRNEIKFSYSFWASFGGRFGSVLSTCVFSIFPEHYYVIGIVTFRREDEDEWKGERKSKKKKFKIFRNTDYIEFDVWKYDVTQTSIRMDVVFWNFTTTATFYTIRFTLIRFDDYFFFRFRF